MVERTNFINQIIQGDCLDVLSQMPEQSVDCVVTSPPYYGLRDYGVEGQIGLENTFEEYSNKMLAITAELKRVLKREGTMWWNHGDSYASQGRQGGDFGRDGKISKGLSGRSRTREFPAKSLIMQPYRLAQKMIDEQQWILRNIIIWHKPNCLPSSVKDRFTVDFEYLFFFVKNKKYYFEPQYEPVKQSSIKRLHRAVSNKHKWINGPDGRSKQTINQPRPNRQYKRYEQSNAPHEFEGSDHLVSPFDPLKGRNKRCVWTIPTRSFPEAHFAVYPPDLIEPPLKAGCPEFVCKKCGKGMAKVCKTRNDNKDAEKKRKPNRYTSCNCKAGFEPGIVLDPFMGSGTTAVVARQLGRSFVGIELNPEYIRIARRRLKCEEVGNWKFARCA